MARDDEFVKTYNCYSTVMAADYSDQKSELVRKGGKILMPPSALHTLMNMNVTYPMMFKVSMKGKSTHCGVFEFVAEEGTVLLPLWMMQNLSVNEG